MNDQPQQPEPVLHELKTSPRYFQKVWERKKTFEIRHDDREFRAGDLLKLEEWDGEDYTDRYIVAVVTYLTPFPGGLKPGYVCMAIREIGRS